jgi:hypothetical protein
MPPSLRRPGAVAATLALALTGCTGIVRVSVATQGGDANGSSSGPSLSRNGGLVAFSSSASNLVASDTNGHRDAFVRRKKARSASLVSVATDGAQGNGDSTSLGISGNGRYVLFSSSASNLVARDGNGATDVFVRDRVAKTTRLVDRTAGGTPAAGGSSVATMSKNGSKVAFEAAESDFGGSSSSSAVFVADLRAGTIRQVSDSLLCPLPNPSIRSIAMNANATLVAYGLDCFEPVSGPGTAYAGLVVHDVVHGNDQVVWHTTWQYFPYTDIFAGSLSFAGKSSTLAFAVYDYEYPHGEASTPYVRTNGVNQQIDVAEDVTALALSADGRYLVYETPFGGELSGGKVPKVALLDRQTGKRYWVSVNTAGQASDDQPNGASFDGVFSTDGSVIGFDSYATNLVTGDNNASYNSDVFTRSLRDVLLGSPR